MVSATLKGLSILQFNNLIKYSEVLHFSSTRIGGSSEANYSSLNLGFNSGDNYGNVITNRNKLCSALEINSKRFVFPKQTHTATTKVISDDFFSEKGDPLQYLLDTDALITNLKGICIAVKTADCVPVLLYDPRKKVVAAIHAGWRGTAQNIVFKTVQKLKDEFDTDPSDLIAGIGPSISPGAYEVGSDVYNQFDPMFYEDTDPLQTDKKLLNLWKANHQQLIMGGVNSQNIEIAQLCTWSDSELFFSARRDGAKTGRMATGIMMWE